MYKSYYSKRQKKTIIFIISAPRSGSTLLDKFLGANSDSISLGELNYLSKEYSNNSECSCRKTVSKCQHWIALILKYRGGNFNTFFGLSEISFAKKMWIDLLSLLFIINVKNKPPKYLSEQIKITAMIFNELNVTRKEHIFIDSSKAVFRAFIMGKILSHIFDIRYIYLVRDGRGVTYSQTKKSYKLTSIEDTDNLKVLKAKHSVNYQKAMKIWKRRNIKNYLLLTILKKNNFKIVKYEKLCNNPSAFFSDISDYISMKWEDRMLDLDNYCHHMVGGNSSRINAKTINRIDDEWKVSLTETELKQFDKYAGKLNKKLGYD